MGPLEYSRFKKTTVPVLVGGGGEWGGGSVALDFGKDYSPLWKRTSTLALLVVSYSYVLLLFSRASCF